MRSRRKIIPMGMEYLFVGSRRPIKVACLAVYAAAIAGCNGTSLVGAFGSAIQGSGKKAAEARKVPAFSGIEFPGSGKVEYRVGSPQSVRIETDDNLLSRVETTVVDGKLRVSFKGSVSTRIGLNVAVVAPACRAAELSGSGNIRISGLKEERFDAVISGSGDLAARGEAAETHAVVSGSGNMNLSKLATRDANAQVSGSGEIRLAPTMSLDAQITGSGNIRYLREPNKIRRDITGSGSVTKG
jgi:hypothetical protein